MSVGIELPHRRGALVAILRARLWRLLRPRAVRAFLATLPHDRFVGWGLRPSGLRARRAADATGQGATLIEDGFLRSLGRHDPPLSLIADRRGIYYDASRPSDLDALIAQPLSPPQIQRAEALIARWQALGLSKYNHARDYPGPLPHPYVLVVDQVAGDLSLIHGGARGGAFAAMIAAACAEHPDATIVIKGHPDHGLRGRRGHFDAALIGAAGTNGAGRVLHITGPHHPVRLIRSARAVYCVTSQLGFEALLHGVPVRCFGMPFYAGWGLTRDALPAPRRRAVGASLPQLAHAALIAYPHYRDPVSGASCPAETIVEALGEARYRRTQFPARLYAYGFSPRKRPILRRFLAGSAVTFLRDASQLPAGAPLVLWGRAEPSGLPASAHILRVEDGFLRSVGLGAALVQPMSWVVDDLGIHYDATRPSRLEAILNNPISATESARAEALRQRMLAARLSKYNLPGPIWQRPANVSRVILVPGQVESDAALALGPPGIRRNIDLIRRVRAANPDAYVIYKPHPDVRAGLRAAGRDEAMASAHCDELVGDVCTAALLDAVDEVHVMTSLIGFEALLRGRAVTCYGVPFYSGWGLTDDLCPTARRHRALSLAALVHGALIAYPRYVSPRDGAFLTPEAAVAQLAQRATRRRSRPAASRRLRQRLVSLWLRAGTGLQ